MTPIYPHRIRLRGPWDCEPVARTGGGPLPARCRLTIPCRWGPGGLGDFAGSVRFRRRFHWPAAPDPEERIWLTFAGVTGAAEVSLNGTLLGRHEGEDPFDFEVTGLVRVHNQLEVLVTADPAGGLWGEVALEVRRTAGLRDVRLEPDGQGLRITGRVVGTAPRRLELYVLADQATAAYATIQAKPDGAGFALPAPAAATARQIRVELIDGGVVWDQVEVPLSSQRG